MIGIILRIIVFDQERTSLHSVVVTLAFLQATHPGKPDLVKAGLANFIQPALCFCFGLCA